MISIAPAVNFIFFDESCQVRTATGNFTFDGGSKIFKVLEKTLKDEACSAETLVQVLSDEMHDADGGRRLYEFLLANRVIQNADLAALSTRYEEEVYSRFVLFPDDELLSELKQLKRVFLLGNESLLKSISSRFTTEGYTLVEPDDGYDIAIYIGIDAGSAAMLDANRQLLTKGQKYLFVNIERTALQIGPLVVPSRTACYECLHKRAYTNALHKQEFLALSKFSKAPIDDPDSIVTGIIENLVINELKKLCLGNASATALGKQIELDLCDYSSVSRNIVKVPRCKACSSLHKVPAPALRDST